MLRMEAPLCFLQPLINLPSENYSPLCHPDRSAAQWRDLQFDGPVLEMFLGTPGAPLILLQPDFPNLSHVFVGPIKSRGRFAPFRAIG